MNIKKRCAGFGIAALGMVALGGSTAMAQSDTNRLNILLITADDLGIHSVGCFGGAPAGLTPNLDHFSEQGMRFFRAHVTAAICQPSRTVLGTGLYPHHSGGMGFMHANPGTPSVVSIMQKAGYLAGCLGKLTHSTPCEEDRWDYAFDQRDLGDGRSPQIYYQRCKTFFDRCHKENKPFYFMVNSHDSHRPFQYADKVTKGAEWPSKLYTPAEVNVPGYVPDLPEVREELAAYQNSVRRLDDTVGKILQSLDESGYAGNTLVMFLSDNGASLPFAKCNCYLASTHTPWMARWPGIVQPGTADKTDFISGIDFLPTVLDAAGIRTQNPFDGKSFVPLLKGEKQPGRDQVFTQIDRQSGGGAVPMRCVQNARFGYIFTPWSDGKYVYHNANEGQTFKAMQDAANNNPAIAERVTMFRYRVPEEFYDLENDPDCLNNLIDNPEYKNELETMRGTLLQEMEDSKDPLLEAFQLRDNAAKRTEIVRRVYGVKTGKKRKGKNTDEADSPDE